ncbi:MAG: Coenzyme F420 hydrogenase/dehydrogenase, beta subunit C-terminal domain [Clostridia bacterium]|nr:Coenzyme F420 hydrogenase/dehydrogenase, beta subunit C-terminal domain [Clostridia bacterium]
MLHIEKPSACSGCGACRAACPVDAITMQADAEGFLYPVVDEATCIRCGKCVRICPVTNRWDLPATDMVAYAACTNDPQVRQNSSSGGIFTEIATYILEQNGVVFGAALGTDGVVEHIAVESVADLEKLRSSKYVQSVIGDTYVQAKTHLEAGRPVLFTGTPCQIAGLYSYLPKTYENLYTQDLICHGVPSPLVWQKYVQFREGKAGAALQNAGFRHKQSGWKRSSLMMEFTNEKTYIQSLSDDPYLQAFLRNYCLRPSCYDCAFKTKTRPADITLADYWGIEKVHPVMDDDQGTSLVILHSQRGRQLFEAVRDRCSCCPTDVDKALQYNTAMTASVPLNDTRTAFMRDIADKDFAAVCKYVRVPMKRKIKQAIKRLLGR